ncbi:MAG: serine/threonine-protein kinase, partial [Myxococcota bacterium]
MRSPTMPDDPRPRVPGYALGEELGCGGFARVWAAVRTGDGATAAIKVSHIAGRDTERRFAREGQALDAVGPPAAPALHRTGVLDDGRPYLVMERIAGIALSSHPGRRDSGRAIPAQRWIAATSSQILQALHRVHERGLVHLDIKPQNILYVAADHELTARCVLIDFGLSRLASAATRDPAERSELTPDSGADLVFGSLEYLAPERLTGQHASDRRTDLYSFGVLLYEL